MLYYFFSLYFYYPPTFHAFSTHTGKYITPETRAKISEAMSGANHHRFMKTGITPVNATQVCVYLASNNTLVSEFTSQVEAAKFFKVNQSTVSRYLQSGNVFQSTYILRKSLLP